MVLNSITNKNVLSSNYLILLININLKFLQPSLWPNKCNIATIKKALTFLNIYSLSREVFLSTHIALVYVFTIKLLQPFLHYLVVVALEIKFKIFLDKDKEKTIAHFNSLLLKAISLFFFLMNR